MNIPEKLTIDGDIISQSGRIMFTNGESVTVKEAIFTNGYWSRLCPDIYVKPKLSHIKIMESSGDWLPSTFKELKNAK